MHVREYVNNVGSSMIQYPSDQKEAKVLRLLRAFQDSPRQSLLEKLMRLNMGIICEILEEFSLESEEKQEMLLGLANKGMQEAFHQFNLESEFSFTEFSRLFIREKLHKNVENSPLCLTREEQEILHPVAEKGVESVKLKTLELLELYRQCPTLRLRNHLVHLNIGLVRKESVHWAAQCNESPEELVQVGCLGLIRAIERFDLSRGNAFSSFAVPYIRGEIQHYLRDKSPTIRVPRSWQIVYNEASHYYKTLRAEFNREPTEREIAEKLKIPVMEWQEIKMAFQNRSPLSLDSPIYDDEESTASLGDLLHDARYRNFQLAQEDSMRLNHALENLEQRTREILEFVFIKEFTYKEAAEALGISAVTVSRQVRKGLKLLREVMLTPLDS